MTTGTSAKLAMISPQYAGLLPASTCCMRRVVCLQVGVAPPTLARSNVSDVVCCNDRCAHHEAPAMDPDHDWREGTGVGFGPPYVCVKAVFAHAVALKRIGVRMSTRWCHASVAEAGGVECAWGPWALWLWRRESRRGLCVWDACSSDRHIGERPDSYWPSKRRAERRPPTVAECGHL
jgi:hypothetical protein